MKTVFKDGVYERVDNEVGEIRTKNQGWKYVPKSEWKQNARGAVSIKQEEADTQKKEAQEKKATRRSKLKAKQRPADALDSLMK